MTPIPLCYRVLLWPMELSLWLRDALAALKSGLLRALGFHAPRVWLMRAGWSLTDKRFRVGDTAISATDGSMWVKQPDGSWMHRRLKPDPVANRRT